VGAGAEPSLRDALQASEDKDVACLALELDGSTVVATVAAQAGAKLRTLDGPTSASVAIPQSVAGLFLRWADEKSPEERGLALPRGVQVGEPLEDGKIGGEKASSISALPRLLGRAAEDPSAAEAAKRAGMDLATRKDRDARHRMTILGYESDDEVDDTDGGRRCYDGSNLSLKISSTSRAGVTYVLPEEALSMIICSLRQRAAKQLCNVVPLGATLVVPGAWTSMPRSAAVAAVANLGMDFRLLSASVALTLGTLATNRDTAAALRGALAPTAAGEGEGSMDAGSTLCLAITGCLDNLEVALVRVEGERGAADKGSSSVKWVRAVRSLVCRGSPAGHGLDDVRARLEKAGADKAGKYLADVATGDRKSPRECPKEATDALREALAPSLAEAGRLLAQVMAKYNSVRGPGEEVSAVFVRGGLAEVPEVLSFLKQQARDHVGASAAVTLSPRDAAAKGATALGASRQGLRGSVFAPGLSATDTLSAAVAVSLDPASRKEPRVSLSSQAKPVLEEWLWEDSDAEVLFPQDAAYPGSVERRYTVRSVKRNASATILEQAHPDSAAVFRRVHPLGNPLRRKNTEGAEVAAVAVTLRYTLDENGLLVVDDENIQTRQEAEAEREAKTSPVVRNFGRVMLFVVLALLLAAGLYSPITQMVEQHRTEQLRHAARKAALSEFYQEVNPDKISEIDRTLSEFKGRESALWRKLENKYGKRPPRPNLLTTKRAEEAKRASAGSEL